MRGTSGNRAKVVLFDLDGTLVKAGGAGRLALNRAVERLYGLKDVCFKFSLAGRMDRDNFELAFKAARGRRPTARERRGLEAAYLRRLPLEVRRAVREKRYAKIPGISKLIEKLSRRPEVLVGLGTGNMERGARIKLRPSGLLRYFAFGGYGSDGRSRVHMLRVAVRRAKAILRARMPAGGPIAPGSVFVIGDTPRDVRAGKKAGYRTGAVTRGFGEPEALRRARPELLAPDFRDRRLWLDWISSLGIAASGQPPCRGGKRALRRNRRCSTKARRR